MMRGRFRIQTISALCLIGAVFWTGGTTLALDGGGGAGKGYMAGAFWGTDLDRNEFISEKEATASTAKGLHKVFHQVDKNGDGRVGYYEFAHFLRNHPYYMKLAGKNGE